MILPGPMLKGLCFPVWGKDWKTELGRRIGVSRQTIHAKSKSKTGLTKAFKRQVLAALESQMADTATPINLLREDVGSS